MTRDDIIRMAQEAYGEWYPNAVPPELERFATLVAAAEREAFAAILKDQMIRDGWRQCAKGQSTTQFCALAEDAVLAEREACAQVCDLNAEVCNNNSMLRDVLMGNAAAIRARGFDVPDA